MVRGRWWPAPVLATHGMKLLVLLTLLLGCLGCAGCSKDDKAGREYAAAMVIVHRLVERDALHPMHEDKRISEDSTVEAVLRREASERAQASREDFVKLRSLISTGRPLADYTPIERLGRFVGTDPDRFFLCGLLGYVRSQGPEPYSIRLDVDASGKITKVGKLVTSR